MDNNELKKYLYRNKPIAKIDCVSKKGIVYKCELPERFIYFLVPLDDIGDATFNTDVEAQLLIRYIYE